jgi:hypothetical protein
MAEPLPPLSDEEEAAPAGIVEAEGARLRGQITLGPPITLFVYLSEQAHLSFEYAGGRPCAPGSGAAEILASRDVP